MKLFMQLVGVGMLVVIFIVVYTLVINVGDTQSRFNYARQSIGGLGGYHLFSNLTFSEEDDFYRITFWTELNRGSILETSIKTPYIAVTPATKDDPILFGDGERLLPELGDYHLVVNLADTRQFDLNGETAEFIFQGQDRQTINQGPINEIRIHQPPDDSLQQVLVGLNQPAPFRLQADPKDAGIVWLDILK